MRSHLGLSLSPDRSQSCHSLLRLHQRLLRLRSVLQLWFEAVRLVLPLLPNNQCQKAAVTAL